MSPNTFQNPVRRSRKQPTPAERVRSVLGETIEKLGGFTATAVAVKVTENTIRNWWKLGCLNTVDVEHALRFADKAGVPIDHFLVNWPS